MASSQKLQLILASPRGFCAGVDRAIKIVEKALEKYGPPVYVRHEIVHNRFVVESLEEKGAIFVDELNEIPDGFPVIFSAHGVPKSVPEAARLREMFFLDATCPLVSKVHREVEHHYEAGHKVVLIGHAGHVEVIGTMGQLPEGAVVLVENIKDVENLSIPEDQELAFATQTTLSVDETKDIVEALQKKYPQIIGPRKEDICFATTNRQMAIKRIAEESDAVIVIGAPNSSNSKRLVETAISHGCTKARLFQRAAEIDWDWLNNVERLGISAGASAPEELVDEVIAACRERFSVEIKEVKVVEENVAFNIPRILRETSEVA